MSQIQTAIPCDSTSVSLTGYDLNQREFQLLKAFRQLTERDQVVFMAGMSCHVDSVRTAIFCKMSIEAMAIMSPAMAQLGNSPLH